MLNKDDMLRSLFSIIVSVIAGLGAAKFLEGGIAAVMGGGSEGVYALLLVASWFTGAFIAALIALLLGRRWAPLGMLAAGTIFFSAFMTLLSASLGWWLWPAAGVAAAAGGWLALRVGGAKSALPVKKLEQDIFPDE